MTILLDAIRACIVISAALALALLYTDNPYDRPIEHYPSDSFTLKSATVEEFAIEATLESDSSYFELALLSADKNRYFLRYPTNSKLLAIQKNLPEGEAVEVFHLEETGKNGGKRIVELRTGKEVLLSLSAVQEEQIERNHHIKYWSILALAIAAISFLLLPNKKPE